VDLVRLFDEIRTEGFVRLRGIPLAAHAEVAHERESIVERWLGVHGTIYYPGNAQSDETRLGRHRPRRVVTQCRVDRGTCARPDPADGQSGRLRPGGRPR